MSWPRRSSQRVPPVKDDRRTSTVMQDEPGGIALVTEKNQELSEEYQRLLYDYQQIKVNYEIVEGKYQETQKENVKVKRHMELNEEKFNREKTGLVKQKDDLNVQNEKLRKELREKSSKVCLNSREGHRVLIIMVYTGGSARRGSPPPPRRFVKKLSFDAREIISVRLHTPGVPIMIYRGRL